MLVLSEAFDFSKIDETAIIISLVGWTIVLVALILLFFIFQNIPALIYYKSRKEERKKAKEIPKQELVVKKEEVKQNPVNNTNVAISMALYLFFNDLHDEESNIITIKKVEKPYSPWNSKIYGVMGNQIKYK